MKQRTPAEHEQIIREWFERHRKDYCARDLQAPPLVWSEYFQWLLDALETARRGDE